jgi:hypothetical protein
MANILKIKRGLEADRSGVTPAEGEFLYTTDEKKLYIGDGSTAGGNLVTSGGSVSDNVFSIEAAVDFTTASAQTVGTLPALADVLRTSLIVGTPSDAVTTTTVGDATNGAAAYMLASENDPEVAGRYISDTFVSNGAGARTMQATVATPGSVGSGTCVIEFRLT